MNNKKIVLIGAFPPPYGGISIHVQRLHGYLLDKGYESHVISPHYKEDMAKAPNLSYLSGNYNWRQFFSLCYKLFKLRGAIRHYHFSHMASFDRSGWITMLIPGKNVITIHSGSFIHNMKNISRVRHAIRRYILFKADRLIVVNKKIKQYCEELGIPSSKIFLCPAFLKPRLEGLVGCESSIIQKVRKFKKSKGKLFLISGMPTPLYGFTKFLKALSRIRESKFGVIVVFYSPGKKNQNFYDYQNMFDSAIQEFGDNVVVFYDVDNESFIKIMSMCDIYVRPTATDGDSVTIKEALFLGCQVLASSVTERMEGCALFNSDNIDEFASLLSQSLDDPSIGRPVHRLEEDGLLPLVKLFDELQGEI